MVKKRLRFLTLMLIFVALSSVLLASCIRPGSQTASNAPISGGSPSSSTPTVHLEASSFQVASITIPRGSMLTVIDDVAVPHILKNGSWVNGNMQPATEPGAPIVNVNFSGNDTHQIGPFNTAGTFHIFCTIHPGMNLTVVVSNTASGNGSGSGSGSSKVHLEAASFQVPSITIAKGSTLTVIDDVAVTHILRNGSWVNGSQKLGAEPGAPVVNVTFKGNDTQQIGPFNTAGTFHILCIIHPNMNLTIIVK